MSAPHEYEELLASKDEPEDERMGPSSSGLGFGSSIAGEGWKASRLSSNVCEAIRYYLA